MKNSSAITDVRDTSFWVAYYRAKETERADAIFHDPFAQMLVGERGKKISDAMENISRYTEWSVVSRTVIIDRFIEKCIKEGVDAIINLGTGLDARPYRMDLPKDLPWVEVDYPSIIEHKNKTLQNEKPKCKLTRVGFDLADGKKRKEFFDNVAPQAKKVLILTEGVIPYLSPEQVTELSQHLLEQERIAYWITEFFHKRVYRYLKGTVRVAKMQNAPFKFYPEDWNIFFRNLGWVEKETRFSGEIAREFHRRPPMPKWAEFLFRFMPKKAKEESLRLAGYMIFKRAR